MALNHLKKLFRSDNLDTAHKEEKVDRRRRPVHSEDDRLEQIPLMCVDEDDKDDRLDQSTLICFDADDKERHRRRPVHSEDDRLEQLTLIWLDGDAKEYTLHSLRTRAILREMSNNSCLFINDTNEFLKTIQKKKDEKRKVLIIMSELDANKILSTTQNIGESIIIFSKNHQCEVLSGTSELCINETLNSIRPLTPLKGADNSNSYFSYMLFIEILKQMPQNNESKEAMLNTFKDYVEKSRNKKYLEVINEFREQYDPDKATDWYTKDSFVYRLINQAFRANNVQLWYLFRYYIIDLCKELEKVHKEQNIQTSFTVYRGQNQFSTKELKILQSNPGCQVAMNGFFSTSKNKAVAQIFIEGGKNTDDFKFVLFEIHVNTCQLKNVIFVDIDAYMRQGFEQEILFNIGTVFKVISVTEDSEEEPWKIEMEATDEGIPEVKEQLNLERKKFENGSINLSFGQLLLEMNQYVKAESYYQMLLQVLPKSHKDLPSVHDHIGNLYMCLTDWNEAFKYFKIAYDIKEKSLPSNHREMGVTLNGIGNYYQRIGNNDKALEYYMKVLKCKLSRYHIATAQLNIIPIHIIKKDHYKAFTLIIEAQNTLQNIRPSPHAEIIKSYILFGNIYLDQQKYKIANGYYVTALEMSEELAIGHDCRTNCIIAFADFYNKQSLNKEAIEFCHKKLSEYEEHLPSNHIANAYLLMKLGELYDDNHEEKKAVLERALHILEESFHLEYETTATCLMMIAQYYQNKNQKIDALQYYKRALEIRHKIYPDDHLIIKQTMQGIFN